MKDLVDLVLLIENGLRPDRELVSVTRHVFVVRATHALPLSIPGPPSSWADLYPDRAEGLTEAPADLPSALLIVLGFWATALADEMES